MLPSNAKVLSSSPEQGAAPIAYPQDALRAQQRYKDESKRCFKIYGRGKYDFGVSPNSDMAIMIDICHSRLVEAGRLQLPRDAAIIGQLWPLHCLFNYYWAAAQKAGVSKEDVGRQLEAEYGVNPIPFLPPPPTQAEADARKASFKEKSLGVKRELLKNSEARPYIPVDARGEPVWDEEKNGEFVVIVVRTDKGRGLSEFGTV